MQSLAKVSVSATIALSVALGGCRKKVAITGADAQNGAEGRACPADMGMISDGEANSNQINPIQNRGGYWYTFVDEKGSNVTPQAGSEGGTFAMTAGVAQGSQFAAHMNGDIASGDPVYAGMGMNFVDPKGPYDASKYKGFSFWAKKGPGSTAKLRLKVPDADTDPDGKVCTECFNDFGMDLTLTDDWAEYTIPFTALKQLRGWGSPHPSGVDPSHLYGLQFQVNDSGQKFDIWLDTIAFTGCGG